MEKSELPITKKTFGPDNNQVEFSSDVAADFLDVVFCIDVTGSMSTYIERSKKVIINMITYFSESEEKPLFGVVAYRDHPPQDHTFVTQIHQLSDGEKALAYVKTLSAQGGGDTPEAVLQGLLDSAEKMNWRNLQIADKTYKKLLIHVGDAPPHGKEFNGGQCHDSWPDKCPSGITLAKLKETINGQNIYYHFCRLTTMTDIMIDLFKKSFTFFELIDMVVNQENISAMKKDFEEYRVEHDKKEYAGRVFEEMDYGEQQACYYEAAITKCVQKNKKK